MFLSRHARQVTLLVRADSLEKSMSYYLIRQIDEIPNIEVRLTTEVVGRPRRRPPRGGSRSATARPGTQETAPAGYLFVFIGAAPRTEWLDGVLDRDARGFVLTGPDLLVRRPPAPALGARPRSLLPRGAACPGVFAAGDVRANSVKRVASAVGEGAMAIQLIHGYLERT